MKRVAVTVALAAVTAAGLVALPGAIAGPPAPPGQVPCPSITLTFAERSVLVLTRAGTTIPTSLLAHFGAVAYPGVPAIGLHPFVVPPGVAPAFIDAVRVLPGVRSADYDRVVREMRTPHDPLLAKQWALAKIRATTAWNTEIGASNPVTVAVLDTGVDGTHPDLVGRVTSTGFDFYDGDTNATDEQFHGTAVASVIAADTDNRIGISGISWRAQIMPVRVLGPDGSGTECTIEAGIVWAASNGAQVANMSLGAEAPCSTAMQEAVDFATTVYPTVLVAAVGNDGAKQNPSMEPANCTGVVGVGATDSRDRIASFSEHGPQVMLSAPGVRILAAYRTSQGGHTYAYFDGTSLAAPMVSGVAALLIAHFPAWTPAQVIARLVATATDLGKKGRDPYYGYGRIDAARALTGH